MSDRSHVTAHVLDASLGRPAKGMAVHLSDVDGTRIASSITDDHGRISSLGPTELPSGVYRLTLDSGAYFAASDTTTFYPQVDITFEVTASDQHYHVPLLLSPFAYTTYRGS